ncbi:MAG: hypothetical protein H6981_03330 [Gammaproteobacteria bacterium]|nr:hypothetical protein [Gammaproteobacteria bacterium]MCP5135821.1 hypothetical protein [Gammaproteobacteria bacterium]
MIRELIRKTLMIVMTMNAASIPMTVRGAENDDPLERPLFAPPVNAELRDLDAVNLFEVYASQDVRLAVGAPVTVRSRQSSPEREAEFTTRSECATYRRHQD